MIYTNFMCIIIFLVWHEYDCWFELTFPCFMYLTTQSVDCPIYCFLLFIACILVFFVTSKCGSPADARVLMNFPSTHAY